MIGDDRDGDESHHQKPEIRSANRFFYVKPTASSHDKSWPKTFNEHTEFSYDLNIDLLHSVSNKRALVVHHLWRRELPKLGRRYKKKWALSHSDCEWKNSKATLKDEFAYI